MVVRLAFDKLPRHLFLSLDSWERWDDNLRVCAKKEVAQDLEIRVEAFNAPLHWESVNCDHHALILGQTSILGSDILVDPSNDAGCSHVTTQDGIFSSACVSSTHDRGRPTPLKSLIKHVCSALVENAAATRSLIKVSTRNFLLEISDDFFQFIPSEVVDVWSGILLLDDVLKEALLIVAFGDDIDEDVVLFPHAVNLIVLILDDSALSMPRDALVHVLLLRDVFAVRVRECCP